jgi:hypothetical protein
MQDHGAEGSHPASPTMLRPLKSGFEREEEKTAIGMANPVAKCPGKA